MAVAGVPKGVSPLAAGGIVRFSCKLLLDFVRNSNAFCFELWAKKLDHTFQKFKSTDFASSSTITGGVVSEFL